MNPKILQNDPRLNMMPQKGLMLLLNRILNFDEIGISCEIIVSPFFKEQGILSSAIAIEYMAQTIAAHAIVLDTNPVQTAKMGFIINIKDLKLFSNEFFVDQTLISTAQVETKGNQILIYNCTVKNTAEFTVSSGVISIFQAQTPNESSNIINKP